MFVCKIENSKNKILRLTQNESKYQVINVEGLNPPSATINRTPMAGVDGARFNSSRLNERNVVITIRIRGNVEENRHELYSFFRIKDICKFYYKNENRDVYVEGYCETIECGLFTNQETMQISLICPDPYFKSLSEIVDDISKSIAKFEFPFAIDSTGIEISTLNANQITNVKNDSDSTTGMIIEAEILDDVASLEIKNVITSEYFKLVYDFVANDKIIIDTNSGSKSIKLIRYGEIINIFPAIQKGSTFLQLAAGDNMFSYTVDEGVLNNNINIIFRHHTLYGGV